MGVHEVGNGPSSGTADKVRVVLVDDAPRTVANLRRLLAFESDIEVVGDASSAAGAMEAARRFNPDVIIMDLNLPDMDGLRATEQLGAEMPLTPVILTSVQDDREYLRRAMEAGARHYLTKPYPVDELLAAIRRVHELEARKRRTPEARRRAQRLVQGSPAMAGTGPPAPGASDSVTDPPQSARPAPPAARPSPAPGREGGPRPELTAPMMQDLPEVRPAARPRPILEGTVSTPLPPLPPPIKPDGENGIVTVVFSGKGGVGKSTIAINLAALLGQETGASVAMVDMDLQFGDLAVMLGLDPQGTMADVTAAWPHVDAPLLGSLMPEAPGGMRVLASPLSPELADLVTAEQVRRVITTLKAAFDHVIVDCGQHLDDKMLEAMECADRMIVITDLNVPAIKDAKLVFKLFEQLGLSFDRVLLVLNRSDAPSDVSVDQLEANLHTKVSVRIPSQGRMVLQSIQKGVPVVLSNPDAEISRKMRELVGCLVPLEDAKATRGKRPRRGLLRRAQVS
ncbi:MAG TPA: response regulator [Candidatus Nitrosotalea sp.]|nr:response regulator [Candidatus Nitrosotalea sp.]